MAMNEHFMAIQMFFLMVELAGSLMKESCNKVFLIDTTPDTDTHRLVWSQHRMFHWCHSCGCKVFRDRFRCRLSVP